MIRSGSSGAGVPPTSLPLPAGAATEGTLAALSAKVPSPVAARVPVDGSGVTQPVSGSVVQVPLALSVAATGLYGTKLARNITVLGMRDQGWSSTSALGDVAQYLDTSQALINTPTVGQTLYVVSTSAADTAAGTGVQSVRIVYLDAAGAQQVSAPVALAGLTPVSLGAGFTAIQWMETLTAGSGGVAAGAVSVTSTNGAATVSTTFERIAAGGDRSMSGRYKVPTGYTAYLTDWHVEAISATMQARLRVDVMADDRSLSAGVFHFQDETFLASGQNAQRDQPYLKCPAGSVIKVSAIPGAAPAGNKCGTAIQLLLVED